MGEGGPDGRAGGRMDGERHDNDRRDEGPERQEPVCLEARARSLKMHSTRPAVYGAQAGARVPSPIIGFLVLKPRTSGKYLLLESWYQT